MEPPPPTRPRLKPTIIPDQEWKETMQHKTG